MLSCNFKLYFCKIRNALAAFRMTPAIWGLVIVFFFFNTQAETEKSCKQVVSISYHSPPLFHAAGRTFKVLDPPRFSGGDSVAGYLTQNQFDLLDPHFKLSLEQKERIENEANMILGHQPGRALRSFKDELEMLGLGFHAEVALEDNYIQDYQQGLKWESFRIISEGDHWLNKVVHDLEKKGWPVDLYLDPALLTLHSADGMTFQNTRRNRIGFFLYSDLIYSTFLRAAGEKKSSLIESHEWIHVLFELSRRNILEYHSKSPVHMFMVSKGSLGKETSYGRVLYFEELVAYAHQLSIASGDKQQARFAKAMIKDLSKQVIEVVEHVDQLDLTSHSIVKLGQHRFLKVGDELKDLALYVYLPADRTAADFLNFARDQLKKSRRLAEFNLKNVDLVAPDEFRKKQIQFINAL